MFHAVWSAIIWLFYILPDFLGYILAAAGLAVIVMPEVIKSLEDKKRVRIVVSIILMAIGIGSVVSNQIQQSVAVRVSAVEREKVIKETSEQVAAATSASVTKTIAEEYQSMITDLTGQIEALKQQLTAQAKDVGIIKGSAIVSGKNPIKVEVTNGATPTTVAPSKPAELQFVLYANGDFIPDKQMTVPLVDGVATFSFIVTNESGVTARDGTLVARICTVCTFKEEPAGWQHINGAQQSDRNKDFQRILASSSAELTTLKVGLPVNYTGFDVDFLYLCDNCLIDAPVQKMHINVTR